MFGVENIAPGVPPVCVQGPPPLGSSVYAINVVFNTQFWKLGAIMYGATGRKFISLNTVFPHVVRPISYTPYSDTFIWVDIELGFGN